MTLLILERGNEICCRKPLRPPQMTVPIAQGMVTDVVKDLVENQGAKYDV